jgi:hypothetical protein
MQATSYDDIQDNLLTDDVAEEEPGSYDDDFNVALAPRKGNSKSRGRIGSDDEPDSKMATKKVTSRHPPLRSYRPHTDCEIRANHPSRSSLRYRNALLLHQGRLEDSDCFRPLGSDPA